MGRRLNICAMLLLVMVSALSGCSKLEQVRLSSATVERLTPKGLRAASLHIAAEVDNPAGRISLTDICAEVLHSGKVVGRLSADPFTLDARSVATYHLKADVSLADGLTLMDVMALVRERDIDSCTVSFSAKVKVKGGLSKKISLKEIPLRKFLEFVKR